MSLQTKEPHYGDSTRKIRVDADTADLRVGPEKREQGRLMSLSRPDRIYRRIPIDATNTTYTKVERLEVEETPGILVETIYKAVIPSDRTLPKVLGFLQELKSCVDLPRSESSTSPETEAAEPDWDFYFSEWLDKEIEDGMTAELGEKIQSLILRSGYYGVKQLGELIASKALPESLASHTLRWLGRIKDPGSFHARFGVLCESLQSKSPIVRDGAALGLALLGNKRAIPALERAIGQELLTVLRADMQQVLNELQT